MRKIREYINVFFSNIITWLMYSPSAEMARSKDWDSYPEDRSKG